MGYCHFYIQCSLHTIMPILQCSIRTAPIDYSVTGSLLTFQPGQTSQCVQVTATDDDIDENDEDFTMTLTTSQDNVNIGLGDTQVTIVDLDGMYLGQTMAMRCIRPDIIRHLYMRRYVHNLSKYQTWSVYIYISGNTTYQVYIHCT